MKTVKFGFSQLKNRTPKFWKRLGMSIGAVSVFMLTSPYLIEMPKWIGYVGFVFGAIAAGLTMFFGETEITNK